MSWILTKKFQVAGKYELQLWKADWREYGEEFGASQPARPTALRDVIRRTVPSL
jgi:hypothetical protein